MHGTPAAWRIRWCLRTAGLLCADREIRFLSIGQPLEFLIADTGVPARTRDTVAAVRQRRQESPKRFDHIFDRIGFAVDEARDAIEAGQVEALGALMNLNQQLLCELDVSSVELDHLVEAARDAGALGAKLSGGGGGGCMIALIAPETQELVAAALKRAGAAQMFATKVVSTFGSLAPAAGREGVRMKERRRAVLWGVILIIVGVGHPHGEPGF